MFAIIEFFVLNSVSYRFRIISPTRDEYIVKRYRPDTGYLDNINNTALGLHQAYSYRDNSWEWIYRTGGQDDREFIKATLEQVPGGVAYFVQH